VVSETETEATGTRVTVIVALPLLPSLVAVIVAVPVLTAVTTPVLETVATAVLSELQATARPANTLLFASSVVAAAVVVPPTAIGDAISETITKATGAGVTIIVDVPLSPSLVPVIVADPGARAVTTPVAGFTVATLVLLEAQVTARPSRRFPCKSLNSAAA
jgi:hypothetical protein